MNDRRLFLQSAGTLGLALAPGVVLAADEQKDKAAEEVAAAEDLMREHGVLNRVLLIYEEGLRRLRGRDEVAPTCSTSPPPWSASSSRTTTRNWRRSSSSRASRSGKCWWPWSRSSASS